MGELVRLPLHRPRVRPPEPEPLWRQQVGGALRGARQEAGQRLVDVAERAGVSPQYLSELERGLKDPSSELLAAVAGALGLRVSEVATRAISSSARPAGPLCLAA